MAKKELNQALNAVKPIIKNRKFQIGLAVVLFLVILISSTVLRTSNLSLLIDTTSGKYLPSDPDACYELRVAQTLLDRGNIDGIDTMRNPGLNLTFAQEMLPKILVLSYKVLHFFGSEITIDKVAVLYPVVAFAVGLIIFFLLCLYLSKSALVSVVASALLAYSPIYLTRNTAGVSSHEALGMPFMFLAILVFVVALTKFEKNWKNTIMWGILSGLGFVLSFWSWTGASNFVLMIMAISSVLYFLFGIEDGDKKKKVKFVGFSAIWVLFSILIMPLTGYSFSMMSSKFLGNYGIVVLFIIALAIVDYLVLKYGKYLRFAKSKWRLLYSVLITIILGLIGLMVLGKNPIDMLESIYIQVLFPMGLGRVGLTVAYYAQPYISDLIAQYSTPIFWLFVVGMVFIGIEIGREIKSKVHKIGFSFAWVIAIFGMMFSRISADHLFNGTNFISQAVYLLSFAIFIVYFAWLYFNDKFSISPKNIILFAWMFVMLLSTRSAVRVIFVIYVFVAFAVAYAIFKFYENAKKSKDSTMKAVFYIASAVSLVLVILTLFGNPIINTYGNYQVTNYSAASMGPIANEQWQLMMGWARNNTRSDAIFAHWWDYGYQIQTMANRTTMLDGGNYNVYWNYMMGRYVLTTPKPDTALSFMKTHNVSYLLIDPTDLGKYAAYSKIGGNKEQDRYSSPQPVVADSKQTTETSTGVRKVYVGTNFVDEDINYNGTFLPGPVYNKYELPTYKSYFLGVIMDYSTKNSSVELKQPIGVFVYNNKQYQLPIRYVYLNGQIKDFKSGINSTFMVIPSLVQDSTTGGVSSDGLGAGIYLSNRVQSSLFARLYLMNDAYNQYPTVKVAHSEDDYVVKILKSQGMDLGEIIYFNGLRSPLKLWKVDYPSNILSNEGFMAESGEYGAADSLKTTI